MTLANFKMPYGKYEGYTLLQIANHDREYLKWCSLNVPPTLRAKIKEYLESITK